MSSLHDGNYETWQIWQENYFLNLTFEKIVFLLVFLSSSIGFSQEAPSDTSLDPQLPLSLSLVDAVRLTLEKNPNIQLQQKQTEISAGIVQQEKGEFDLSITANVVQGVTHTPRTEFDLDPGFNLGEGDADKTIKVDDTSQYRIGLSKPTRFGTRFTAGAEVTRFNDNLNQEIASNRGLIFFSVNTPLLKGAGRKAAGAAEKAAKYNNEAELLMLIHTTADSILKTVSSYWDCIQAQRVYQILEERKTRAAKLVDDIKRIVDADELPKAELDQVRADSSEKQSESINAFQNFLVARQQLGLTIGLPLENLTGFPIPNLEDSIPEPNLEQDISYISQLPYLQGSLSRRTDYHALMKIQKSVETLLKAARRNLLPRLDFNLQFSYAGLEEGSQSRSLFRSLDPSDLVGLSALGILSMDWPFGRNKAKGNLKRLEAVHQQSFIRLQDLSRQVFSEILVAGEELKSTAKAFQKAKEANEMFENAVGNEEKKLKLGVSTLIDLIATEDRFTSSKINVLGAQIRYTKALVKLRFATGTLLQRKDYQYSALGFEDLTSLPPISKPQSNSKSSNPIMRKLPYER